MIRNEQRFTFDAIGNPTMSEWHQLNDELHVRVTWLHERVLEINEKQRRQRHARRLSQALSACKARLDQACPL